MSAVENEHERYRQLIDALHAEVLAQDAPMLKVFERSGVGFAKKHEWGSCAEWPRGKEC